MSVLKDRYIRIAYTKGDNIYVDEGWVLGFDVGILTLKSSISGETYEINIYRNVMQIDILPIDHMISNILKLSSRRDLVGKVVIVWYLENRQMVHKVGECIFLNFDKIGLKDLRDSLRTFISLYRIQNIKVLEKGVNVTIEVKKPIAIEEKQVKCLFGKILEIKPNLIIEDEIVFKDRIEIPISIVQEIMVTDPVR
ncbi:MAG: hypothetical protein QXM93_05580 [Candidatus Methanomethyliaceae archaeon]